MEPLTFEFVTVEEARKILDGEPPVQVAPDWNGLRRAPSPEDAVLSDAAMRWLLSLPAEARPLVLCRRYPRIGNQLAALCANPAALHAFLVELLIDKRGGRQGFPDGIALELSRLHAYMVRQLPGVDDAPGWPDLTD
ncbi:hypothetical protein [Cupriavidus taiwanensis]|uniref:Uncharacterized protein n=2 Tax=Cupriavidus taiwanensis TaxID=164546 RepID=B2AII1_CUPTR|nr:hypothetical protein [Cupriavidus taiwanensis]CAP63580.1 conserved hypothetical protein [Cupriavidus taiwanensis LMG 19424]SOY71077.1 conserved hypothetical protein [Cupriavidus taiwanensis]SOZ09720.1 conserved hypothetical protein [Cupriavidus taiwanensis]SOZ11839.1 conserved hypothetical protein [Cupriavidus taiwanensis]SOZ43194.1 conserved hypothetical protein [Cupriavidus taiwanensis]